MLKAYAVTTADCEQSAGHAAIAVRLAARSAAVAGLEEQQDRGDGHAGSQHEAIRGVIEEIERGSPLDAGSQLEVHPLRNADPDVVMQVLNNLVTKHSRALLSVDAKAKTTDRRGARAATSHDSLDDRATAIDAAPARSLSIGVRRAADGGNGDRKTVCRSRRRQRQERAAPSVESDVASQRLFVRANAEQLAQIRDLLVKMGETNLVAGCATARSA